MQFYWLLTCLHRVFFQDDNIHHSRKGDYVIIEMELKNFIQNGQNISLLK